MDSELVNALHGFARRVSLLQRVLRVTVAEIASQDGDELPNVLGTHAVLATGIRFVPLFPFEPGIRYRAIFDPRPLGGAAYADIETFEFQLPDPVSARPARVEQVFPSAAVLPENLLRFYVAFSNPMPRGQAKRQIQILGPDDSPVPDVLYRAPVELWDSAMRRLTVLLDPGRLKRNVGPNARLGPPLNEGHRYALVVGGGMLDATGHALQETFVKDFLAGPPVRDRVDPAQWRITPPRRRTLDHLTLEFPFPLDCGPRSTGISVADGARQRVTGEARLDGDGRRWTFAPASAWGTSEIHLHIDPDLEDVCGNTPHAPFDAPAGAVEMTAPGSSLVSVRLR
jgi:hypothetical protein